MWSPLCSIRSPPAAAPGATARRATRVRPPLRSTGPPRSTRSDAGEEKPTRGGAALTSMCRRHGEHARPRSRQRVHGAGRVRPPRHQPSLVHRVERRRHEQARDARPAPGRLRGAGRRRDRHRDVAAVVRAAVQEEVRARRHLDAGDAREPGDRVDRDGVPVGGREVMVEALLVGRRGDDGHVGGVAYSIAARSEGRVVTVPRAS